MKNGRIAVPSMNQGGLDGVRAGHFGHCDVFTLIDVEEGQIKEVTTIANREHVQGGCMVPVNLLAGSASNKSDQIDVLDAMPLTPEQRANINIVHLHTEELFLLSLYAVGHLVAKEICGRKPCHSHQLV